MSKDDRNKWERASDARQDASSEQHTSSSKRQDNSESRSDTSDERQTNTEDRVTAVEDDLRGQADERVRSVQALVTKIDKLSTKQEKYRDEVRKKGKRDRILNLLAFLLVVMMAATLGFQQYALKLERDRQAQSARSGSDFITCLFGMQQQHGKAGVEHFEELDPDGPDTPLGEPIQLTEESEEQVQAACDRLVDALNEQNGGN